MVNPVNIESKYTLTVTVSLVVIFISKYKTKN